MLVLLDPSADFDTVDHSNLVHVIGIKGTVLDSFRSYLSDKYQFDHVHVVSSLYSRVSHGVPRGSVLKILFALVKFRLGNVIWQQKNCIVMLMTPRYIYP